MQFINLQKLSNCVVISCCKCDVFWWFTCFSVCSFCWQEKIYEVYQSIRFKPEQFNDYLMSTEVGFSCCELLGTPQHQSKGNVLLKVLLI